ncbi:hypothetical protein [Nocardia sp. NPDC048505]|uniref:hypothetical protein n=1 Tax=unclassified Nocardia TaxID=2637762 RepID=UPI0033DD354C
MRPSRFQQIVAWASRPGRRLVRRVITTSNEEMRQWVGELSEASADIPNHRIHVIDWPLVADGVNFAIIATFMHRFRVLSELRRAIHQHGDQI